MTPPLEVVMQLINMYFAREPSSLPRYIRISALSDRIQSRGQCIYYVYMVHWNLIITLFLGSILHSVISVITE